MYIKREIETILQEAANSFQVITLYGSRQVGKTTTVLQLFGEKFNFVTLDDTDELSLALANPKLFFESHPWPLIVDEVQKAPGLLNEIKQIVDRQKFEWTTKGGKRCLMYVLTGSNQFELQDGISESLAGRTEILNMTALSRAEKLQNLGWKFQVDLDYLMQKQRENPTLHQTTREIFEDIFLGSMPDVFTGESPRNLYYKAYVDTYIEKDVKKLITATSELQFRRFISLLALRTAQQIVYGDIAKDLGISVETCKRWLSILQTSGIIYLLQPYLANASKRIIKTPKLYFMDTGLCAYLCKWQDAEMLVNCAMSGAFFETYVVSEIVKNFTNQGLAPEGYLFYYRDIDKKEVDLLLVQDGTIYPIEIKKGATPTKPTKNFDILAKYKMPIARGMVIENTDKIRAINEKAFAFPVSLL